MNLATLSEFTFISYSYSLIHTVFMISRSGAGNSAQSCHYDEEDVTEEDEGCNEDGCWDDGMGWQGRYRFWGLPYMTSTEKGGSNCRQ